MVSPAAVAFVGGCLGVWGLWELVRVLEPRWRGGAPRLARAAGDLLDVVTRLGREGRRPGAAERRRLLATGAGAMFLVGTIVVGPLGGLALGAAGPWVVARVLRARRARYRAAVTDGAPAMALGLAAALSGGHSLRGAIAEAARSLPGAAGHELRRVAAEIAVGARTEAALEAMSRRVPSEQLDTLVAACLLQQRAGGDLGRLLRECARSFEDEARLAGEVRAATAQARFTGLVVVLLPLGGALLAELASPGFVKGLAGSFLTAWLVGIAVVLQVVAAVAIRRLGRVRW